MELGQAWTSGGVWVDRAEKKGQEEGWSESTAMPRTVGGSEEEMEGWGEAGWVCEPKEAV